jgi:hypothetical protein
VRVFVLGVREVAPAELLPIDRLRLAARGCSPASALNDQELDALTPIAR